MSLLYDTCFFFISYTVVTCGSAPIPAFGSVSTSNETYGGKATYSCNIGYNISGSMIRNCQADGTWDGSLTSCSSKTFMNISFRKTTFFRCVMCRQVNCEKILKLFFSEQILFNPCQTIIIKEYNNIRFKSNQYLVASYRHW